jgi:flagellar motor protein MotB
MLSLTLYIIGYSREDVYYIDPSLRSVIVFTTTKRPQKGGLIRYYVENYNPNYIVYAKPDNYSVSKCKDPFGNQKLCVEFPPSFSFTILQRDSALLYMLPASKVKDEILQKLNISKDNADEYYVMKATAQLISDPERRRRGIVLYDYVSLSFVFPYGFEIYNYYSTAEGKWKLVGSTLNYYSTRIPQTDIYIAFKPVYDTLVKELVKTTGEEKEKKEEVVLVEAKAKGPEITLLKEEIKYPVGVAELTEEDKKLIRNIYKSINWNEIKEVIVEGHADPRPIRGALAKKYPSNWELSIFRSLNVVKYLIELGAPPEKIRVAAAGEFRPKYPNDNEEHMAGNRRVNFYVVK